ncbi:MAG TPA: nucleotide pyrophosphatase/phosphodiesterase family protein [Actinomycetota bacterium]|nr:nucleotide pyrophosphatase/phosphodiesterase family protein [Actinomycetota bacterium]
MTTSTTAAAGETGPPPPPLPRYGAASLADLLPSLLAALDVPGFRNPLGIEPLRRACLLVVDGLGWELLQANRRMAPVLAGAAEHGGPVTTGFPSTTATSLASIGTGLPPGGHGLVGYTIALPGMERAFNCLRWSPYGLGGSRDLRDRFVPEKAQPEPTAFEVAAADGVQVTLVGAGEYAASGFTRAALRGGDYWRTHSLGDQAAGALRGLGKGRRSLVYLYHPDLDRTGHVRGAGAEAWRLELAHIDQLVGQIAERLGGGDAALFVTGDHGMVDLRPEQRVDLADQPELAAGVRLLAGEARARHVHTQRGAADDVLATWRGLLGHAMWVVPGEEAITAGWFGPQVSDDARARVGDVVAAAHGPIGVVQREVDPTQAILTGHHGSMTPAEQLVPFLEIRR